MTEHLSSVTRSDDMSDTDKRVTTVKRNVKQFDVTTRALNRESPKYLTTFISRAVVHVLHIDGGKASEKTSYVTTHRT